jgi:cytochrome c5
MKKVLFVLGICVTIYACSNNSSSNEKNSNAAESTAPAPTANPSNDPNRGIGKFTKVDVSPTLDAAMATAGTKVYDVKCASCHKHR